MATVEVKVSDLTGAQITDDAQAVRLIVEHPDFAEPIGLDVSLYEVQPQLTAAESRFVVVRVEAPDNPNPQRYVLPVEEFDNLFQSIDSTTALQRALDAQHQEQRGRGRKRGGRRQGGTQRRSRIDYSSPEHAGEPHPGRITDAEKEFVRDNLDAVNARLREQGLREISPDDPDTAQRYGLTTEPVADAVVIDEQPPAV
jgi:hypothetical protein